MKTLEIEQISELATQHEALIATAKAGSRLASMVRGAIRGCDKHTDPRGLVKHMLTDFLKIAGFEVEP